MRVAILESHDASKDPVRDPPVRGCLLGMQRTRRITLAGCLFGKSDHEKRGHDRTSLEYPHPKMPPTPWRMVEGGRGLRFLSDSPDTLFVGHYFGREHLERDIALERLVAGTVDLTHAAGSE